MVLFQAAFNFGDVFSYLYEIGVINYVLPFLLVFAIVFAVLEKTQIFGEHKTNINSVIAVVIGMLLVVQQGIVELINLFLPRISLIIVVTLMGLLIIAMLAGKKYEGLSGSVFGVAVILVLIAVVLALTVSPSAYGFFLSEADKQALIRIGIPLGVFLLAIFIVTGGGKKENEPTLLEKLTKGSGGKWP